MQWVCESCIVCSELNWILEDINMPTTKKRYLKGTVNNVEHVIEFVIEDLNDRELVARALQVDTRELRNVGTSSNSAYRKADNAMHRRVERRVL